MVEVLQGEVHVAHVAIAAGPVVPIDRVLSVQLDGPREVLDGLFKIEEAVPHKTPPVEGRCVSSIQGQHLVEVLKGLPQLLPTHLLADSTKVMQRRDVALLQPNGLDVVSLSLLQLTHFVPAEGPVVERLEVGIVQLDSPSVVLDRILVIPLLPVGEPSIVVEVSLGAL